MLRRSLLLVSILILVLLVGACAAPVAPAAPAAEESASTSESADAAPSDAADLSGEITFWSSYNTVSPENETLMNVIIPAFNEKYPNVTVNALALPYEELRTKLLTSIAGGLAPDVVRADIIWVPEFAEMGALARVDELIPDFDTYKEQFYAGPLATNYYNGNYYGIPLDTNTRIQFYSKALFEEAGIENAPTTVEEWNAACAAIAALERPDTYCYAENGANPWNTLPWIWTNGGGITNDDFSEASGVLNGEGTVATATMFKQWLDDGTLSPMILGGGSTGDALNAGTVGIILEGPWMPPIFQAQFPDMQYGMAPMPVGPGGSSSVVGGENMVLFESSQNKDAALAFMQFLAEEEQQIAFAQVGQMPVLKSLTGNEAMPDYFEQFMVQLDTAQPRTPSPEWPNISVAVENAFQYVLRGEQAPQDALDEAATIVDGLLAGEQ